MGRTAALRADGSSVSEKLYGKSYFDHLDDAPEQAAMFNDAMSTLASLANDLVIPAYDFAGFKLIADVGGGHGRLLSAILRSTPTARGILFDLPSVVAGAGPLLDEAGVATRCAIEGGSFMDSVPDGADAYVMKSIIHDWDDDISREDPAQHPHRDRAERQAAAARARTAGAGDGELGCRARHGDAGHRRRTGAHPRRVRQPVGAMRVPTQPGRRHRHADDVDRRGCARLTLLLAHLVRRGP